MPTCKVSELVGAGEPGSMLVVDPGGTCGLAVWRGDEWAVWSVPLDELPMQLDVCAAEVLAVEAYHLQAAFARQQSGSDMPSAQGIGMMRQVAFQRGQPLYMIPTTGKRAGHKALDAAGQAAHAAARNEHQRDAVDLTGFVLREMRRQK